MITPNDNENVSENVSENSWGFFVDIENNCDNQKIIKPRYNIKTHPTLDVINEECEYYLSEQNVVINENIYCCIFCKRVYSSFMVILLTYVVFCVI